MSIEVQSGTDKCITILLKDSTLWERRIIECAIKTAQAQIQAIYDFDNERSARR